MWYREARRLLAQKAIGIGGGILRRPATRNKTADTPTEIARLDESSRIRRERRKGHPEYTTLEEKLEETQGRNGFMDPPMPIPKALNDSSRVLPSGILDHHKVDDSTKPGFEEQFLENPDPKTRHLF